MKLRILIGLCVTSLMLFMPVAGQNKDKAIFIVPKPGFYQNSILKDDQEVKEKSTPLKENRELLVDQSGYQLPNKVELYKNCQWHNPPVSQGNTNTCWCFSTTSFLETEVSPLDWADGEIPISWILTSASVHDSLLALTADRFAQTSAEIQGQTLDHANKGPF